MNRTDFAAAVLIERIVRNSFSRRKSVEIQPLQWSILRYLAEASPDNSSLQRIAGFIGITHAPVSRAARTLERRGLVWLQANPQDGRSMVVILTEAGRNELRRDPMISLAEHIAELPEHQRRPFQSAVQTLATKINGERS